MGKYFVEFDDIARKDLKNHYKSGNKSTIKKIEKILLELTETPFFGEGQPEELKYSLNGYWSRRINQKDRMIYRVEEEIVTVIIVSAMGHYSDK
ncbi:Txe/YoeB family addiction module toxin [Flavobacterium sp. S87F.05.LMB.W.Kidney.N]|uniref:Txe/YoeB family addiction module toxin n=1 Tax=Flavobacterium sp. S87F.05.LMB.W.Kidney.N TaxID=1278758 RepID=UPI0010647562|nr:Txe/YoeB family addiction module toxin [Flavobacterium sp. S87F.05.LMB.W.Kidney.N]TDX09381.1 toxin YoeB [Flavobacterium sp. S87F.05.LMB.W.Kidney.N]